MSRDRDERHASITEFAAELEAFIERTRKGTRLRPAWIVVALVAALLPWSITLFLLSRFQDQGERALMLQALREGDRLVARAERRRADPSGFPIEATALAKEALDRFTMALRWSGGSEPDAMMGIGRARELMGDDTLAERAYLDAGAVPGAESALARIWARRLLEGRRVPETKATIQLKLRTGHPVRSFAEGDWEGVLIVMYRDRDDDGLRLVQGAAAIELKRWDVALHHLNEALRLRPRDSTILFFKGAACAGRGDRDGAASAWADAVRHQPKEWGLAAEIVRRRSALPGP
jgi:tetratricopeptide (TPR) repeat protein